MPERKGRPLHEVMADQDDLDQRRFNVWLEEGQKHGWITQMYCETHDGAPLTDNENEEFYGGFDPCIFAVRVVRYADGDLS